MKRAFWLLSILIFWTFIMMMESRMALVTDGKIAGIARPGLAMEFAGTEQQVNAVLGQPNTPGGDTNRQIIAKQQYLDFVFIVLYWLVFVLGIGGAIRESKNNPESARKLRNFVVLCISAAAICDVLENIGILTAVGVLHTGLWPRWFGPYKWMFFFLALIYSAPLFLRYPNSGSFGNTDTPWTRRFASMTGFLFLIAAVIGIIGVAGSFIGRGSPIVWASGAYGLGFITFLLLLLAAMRGAKRERAMQAHA
jgi:hypothetical protein